MRLQSGVARLRAETLQGRPISSQELFAALEADRRSGALAQSVSRAAVRYQACPGRPGLLEQLGPGNSRTIGRFQDGTFEPLEPVGAGTANPSSPRVALDT